jgi:2-succinyl-5-enolpyruvyl-6-hydroxy-3-cyclohexene-1-carboxylate synthase
VTEPSWLFARTLVDELARCGLTDAAVAPGSRSAPLALALAEQPGIRVHVLLDERSAAFFALGIGKTQGRAAALVCTSGTAAANFHPAVIEADSSRVPLLVLTADRPPELRDTGANQTIDQTRLYGGAVRWFADPGPPRPGPEAARYWRSLAARAWAETLGRPAGPVHLNLPFDEPLVPKRLEDLPLPGREGGRPWLRAEPVGTPPTPARIESLAEAVGGARRGLLVAGWGADVHPEAADAFLAATGWVVLADPLSGLRQGPAAISTYNALLRVEEFARAQRPELVVRLGAAPTSKQLATWLDASIPQVLIDPDRGWADPARAAEQRLAVDPSALLAEVAGAVDGHGAGARDSSWRGSWTAAEAAARSTMDELLDGWEEPFEGRVARDLAAALPDGATLVAGSSMPVRDLESFARPREGLRYLGNRGASGIDGTVATTLGVAAASDGPVAALLGDLAFVHDAGSVLAAARQSRRQGRGAVLVVIDNNGGGIFSFLPQASLPRHFEGLFGTPHDLELEAVATAGGLSCQRVAKADGLAPAVEEAVAAALTVGETRVLLVGSDRTMNVERHAEVNRTVAAALGVS